MKTAEATATPIETKLSDAGRESRLTVTTHAHRYSHAARYARYRDPERPCRRSRPTALPSQPTEKFPNSAKTYMRGSGGSIADAIVQPASGPARCAPVVTAAIALTELPTVPGRSRGIPER
jgi:hypothetical protein